MRFQKADEAVRFLVPRNIERPERREVHPVQEQPMLTRVVRQRQDQGSELLHALQELGDGGYFDSGDVYVGLVLRSALCVRVFVQAQCQLELPHLFEIEREKVVLKYSFVTTGKHPKFRMLRTQLHG